MDKETKHIFIVAGIVLLTLYILRPRVKKPDSEPIGKDRVKLPNEGSPDDEFQNAAVAIQAYRAAVNQCESQAQLNELNRMLLEEHGVKIYMLKNGLLVARNKKGIDIAKEQR